jgi:hypothetical protein
MARSHFDALGALLQRCAQGQRDILGPDGLRFHTRDTCLHGIDVEYPIPSACFV